MASQPGVAAAACLVVGAGICMAYRAKQQGALSEASTSGNLAAAELVKLTEQLPATEATKALPVPAAVTEQAFYFENERKEMMEGGSPTWAGSALMPEDPVRAAADSPRVHVDPPQFCPSGSRPHDTVWQSPWTELSTGEAAGEEQLQRSELNWHMVVDSVRTT